MSFHIVCDSCTDLTEEDLKTIVTVSHEEGVLEDEEKEMIQRYWIAVK